MRTLAIVPLIAVALCGCSLDGEPVEFFQHKYVITKPWLWTTMSDLNDQADVQMGNIFLEAYLIVLTQSRDDFDEGYDLASFSEETHAYLLEDLENTEITGPSPLSIGGRPAVRYVISGQTEGLAIKYWHIAVEMPEDFHQIITWSLADWFDFNESYFEQAVYSLRPTSAPTSTL